MRKPRVLVTGGAGFIGSHLVDELVRQGYPTTIFDNLEDQVHHGQPPGYLNPHAVFVKGDVRDRAAFRKVLKTADLVYHLAARVGVAQSNYEIASYSETNVGGTASLWDIIVNEKLAIRKIIFAASMTSYGEGAARCSRCGLVKPQVRSPLQLAKKDWVVYCPNCGRPTTPMATEENTALVNNSVYSLTKFLQEQMLLLLGKMYRIPVISLRCFNVYGPRQSLSNPYTGVAAIFLSRLKNQHPPIVYEDGLQTRDFVSVHDVVDAMMAALKTDRADYEVVNIASGKPTTIGETAATLAQLLHTNIPPHTPGTWRVNDIRHCFADITRARKLLGWKPKVSLRQGLAELIAWSEEEAAEDRFERAQHELRRRKLL